MSEIKHSDFNYCIILLIIMLKLKGRPIFFKASTKLKFEKKEKDKFKLMNFEKENFKNNRIHKIKIFSFIFDIKVKLII